MGGKKKLTSVALVALAAAALVPISAAKAETPTSTFVFNGEDNRLRVYDTETGDQATLIFSAADEVTPENKDHEHKDLNAQICFQQLNGKTYFIAGEDTGQGGEGDPGWGWFELQGLEARDVSALTTKERGKLVPTYARDDSESREEGSNPENYGCGFLDNGALVLSDVGDQQPNDGANGQLHVWFPQPSDGFARGFGYSPGAVTNASDIRYCKVDITVPTAGGIAIDHGDPSTAADDAVLLAASRPDLSDPAKGWGIYRYTGVGALTPEQCDHSDTPREDVVSAVEAGLVERSVFIQGGAPQTTPSAITASGNGTWYVSSVFDGSIAEYAQVGDVGVFQRYVVGGPPVGQVTGQLPEPLAVGTPYGIGVTPTGEIWYADIGVIGNDTARPGRLMAAVPNPAPLPTTARIVADALQFPDGIGVLTY